jgi:hypothetical protein
MADRNALRLSATLVLIGALFYQVVNVFHVASANDHVAAFTAFANRSIWTAVHLGQFLATAIFTAGLFALSSALNITAGILADHRYDPRTSVTLALGPSDASAESSAQSVAQGLGDGVVQGERLPCCVGCHPGDVAHGPPHSCDRPLAFAALMRSKAIAEHAARRVQSV